MRITYLLTTADSGAGTERAIVTQANAMAEAGHSVGIVSLYRTTGQLVFPVHAGVSITYWIDVEGEGDLSEDQDGRYDRGLLNSPSRVIPAKWDNQFSLLSDVVIAREMAHLDTDILCASTPALALLASEFARTEITVVAQEHRPSMSRGIGLEPLTIAGPRIDCIVSLTDRSTRWLSEHFSDRAPILCTIPNSLPTQFRPTSLTDEKVILAAGRFAPGKQFDQLIQAFSIVNDKFPDWRLRLYGHGSEEAKLRSQATRLGLESAVEFVGTVPDLALEFPKGGIFALASRMEGQSLVIMEAAAAGVPTVAYDCPVGPAELIDHGKSGLLVPINDVSLLAEALQQLMVDPAMRASMGAAAKEGVSRFQPNVIDKLWLQLFERLQRENLRNPRRLDRVVARAAENVRLGHSQNEPSSDPRPISPPTNELYVLDGKDVVHDIAARRNSDLVSEIFNESELRCVPLQGIHRLRKSLALRDKDKKGVIRRLQGINDPTVHVEFMRGNRRLLMGVWQPASAQTTISGSDFDVLRLYRRYTDKQMWNIIGAESAVEFEFWESDEWGTWSPPRYNRQLDRLSEVDFAIAVPAALSTDRKNLWSTCNFPIDVVYTWVDGGDESWAAERDHFAEKTTGIHSFANTAARYRNRNELKYSIRSLRKFAPWIRKIFIVTANQTPSWFADDPDVHLVHHRGLFPKNEDLPTFNSHAIETVLHRIPGLAEHFLYINDDTMMMRFQAPETYFTSNGLAKFFPSPVKINFEQGSLEPHIAAAHNNRRIMQDLFGVEITQSMLHTPHPHLKSVLVEVEQAISEEIAKTRAARFRSPGDISLLSSLAQYFGFMRQKYIPGNIRYAYVGLGREDTELRMTKLMRGTNIDVVTFGESNEGYIDSDATDYQFQQFLEAQFANPTNCEVEAQNA